MVTKVINMLILDDYYNVSDNIEILKGKYAIKNGFIEKIKALRRKIKFRK